MHHVPQLGLTALAVAGPVERGVRRRFAHDEREWMSVASVAADSLLSSLYRLRNDHCADDDRDAYRNCGERSSKCPKNKPYYDGRQNAKQ